MRVTLMWLLLSVAIDTALDALESCCIPAHATYRPRPVIGAVGEPATGIEGAGP